MIAASFMRRRAAATSLATIIACATLASCAAADRSSAAPRAPAAGESEKAGAPASMDAPRAYAAPPGDAPPPPAPARERDDARPGAGPAREAWQELEAARGELDATTGDCALACKALASMDRAASHVCTVSPEDSHCGSARATLRTARRRVRAECMACPNGVSVDPDGPIPSAPSGSP